MISQVLFFSLYHEELLPQKQNPPSKIHRFLPQISSIIFLKIRSFVITINGGYPFLLLLDMNPLNAPEGMTSQDIRSMSEDALLDMDYFLNDDELDDDFGEEGFYLF